MAEKFETNSEFEPEEFEEEFEIDNKKFIRVLSSESFLRALDVGKTNVLHGKESAFYLCLSEKGKAFVPEIDIGSSRDMMYGRESMKIDGYPDAIDAIENSTQCLNLHFHPPATEEEPITPSPNDLNSSSIFSAIAQASENKKDIDILLFRKHKFVAPSEIPENSSHYWNQLAGMGRSQEDVQKALNDNGFESFLISLKQKGDKLKLTKESKDILKKIKKIITRPIVV